MNRMVTPASYAGEMQRRLRHGRVHVWIFRLPPGDGSTLPGAALLSPDELQQADRYRHPLLRARFIARRAAMRRLLALYLGQNASGLRFGYGPHGKPHLAGAPELRFSLSHSRDAVMMAVAWNREVGVDIAAVDGEEWWQEVAEFALSPAERGALDAEAPAGRRCAFMRIWTRKEAYLKAQGTGLVRPTASFSVSLKAMDQDALLHDQDLPLACTQWRIAEIRAPSGFHAALAASGRDWIAQTFQSGWEDGRMR